MHRLRSLCSFSLLVLTALACNETDSAAPKAENLHGLAAEYLDMLAAGHYTELAQRMHFPAIYTDEQLSEDRAEFVATLSSVMAQAGEIISKQPSTDPGPFLQINLAGGTDSYWKSHPAGQGTSTAVFDVEFSKIGPGVVQIALLETSGVREVRSINIGVKGSRPDARETMEGIMRVLHVGTPATEQKTAQK